MCIWSESHQMLRPQQPHNEEPTSLKVHTYIHTVLTYVARLDQLNTNHLESMYNERKAPPTLLSQEGLCLNACLHTYIAYNEHSTPTHTHVALLKQVLQELHITYVHASVRTYVCTSSTTHPDAHLSSVCPLTRQWWYYKYKHMSGTHLATEGSVLNCSNCHPVRTSDLTSSLLVSLLTIFSSPTRARSLR